jgi:hypothetical protein
MNGKWLLSWLLFAGCSVSYYSEGSGDFEQAILKKMEEKHESEVDFTQPKAVFQLRYAECTQLGDYQVEFEVVKEDECDMQDRRVSYLLDFVQYQVSEGGICPVAFIIRKNEYDTRAVPYGEGLIEMDRSLETNTRTTGFAMVYFGFWDYNEGNVYFDQRQTIYSKTQDATKLRSRMEYIDVYGEVVSHNNQELCMSSKLVDDSFRKFGLPAVFDLSNFFSDSVLVFRSEEPLENWQVEPGLMPDSQE